MTDNNNKMALLIDGDNAQAKFIEDILAEAGKHGKVTIRRIYGDWTNRHLSSWKDELSKHAIRPMQKFAFSYGKNSTDTAMIIDAMDILHGKQISGFCIASSDSDYTGLAQRIREEGIFVMGIGSAKSTNYAFVNACDLFVYTENLSSENRVVETTVEPTEVTDAEVVTNAPEVRPAEKVVESPEVVKTVPKDEREVIKVKTPKLGGIKIVGKIDLPESHITNKPIDMKLIQSAFGMVVQDNDMAYLGDIVAALRRLDPGFDPRTYGFRNVAALFRSLSGYFTLVTKSNDKIFVKEID
jgi:uncharacterized LabA/DUF88 family protein